MINGIAHQTVSIEAQNLIKEAIDSHFESEVSTLVQKTSDSINNNGADFTYHTNNDFGKKNIRLLFCKPEKDFSAHFFKNMQEIAEVEGFEVLAAQDAFPLRDALLKNKSDQYIFPSSSKKSYKTEVERSVSLWHQKWKSKLLPKKHITQLSDHPFFTLTIGATSEYQYSANKYRKLPCIDQNKLKESRIYFEGGNCFHINNRENQPQWIIGEDLVELTYQTLFLAEWFSPPSSSKEDKPLYFDTEQETFAQCGDQLYQWLSSGEIPQKIDSLAKEIEPTLGSEKIKETLDKIAVDNEIFLKSFIWGSRTQNRLDLLLKEATGALEQIQKGRSASAKKVAARYLAQIKFIKESVFPMELGVPQSSVHFIPQPAYHLDLMMTPAPRGALFLQNYSLAVTLLDKIKMHSDQWEFNENDLKELDLFIKTTKKICFQLQPLMDQLNKRLTKIGFDCIPTPGAFFGFNRESGSNELLNVNFLNSITGFSDKSNHFYYITAGSQTKGRLGQVLMDLFAAFVSFHAKNTVTYFIGKEQNNFSEAALCLNKWSLGPHCLSLELEVEPFSLCSSEIKGVKNQKESVFEERELVAIHDVKLGNSLWISGCNAEVMVGKDKKDKEVWENLNNWKNAFILTCINTDRWYGKIRPISPDCQIKILRNNKDWQKESNTKVEMGRSKVIIDKISF